MAGFILRNRVSVNRSYQFRNRGYMHFHRALGQCRSLVRATFHTFLGLTAVSLVSFSVHSQAQGIQGPKVELSGDASDKDIIQAPDGNVSHWLILLTPVSTQSGLFGDALSSFSTYATEQADKKAWVVAAHCYTIHVADLGGRPPSSPVHNDCTLSVKYAIFRK